MRELKIYRVHGYGYIIKHFQKNIKKGLTNSKKSFIFKCRFGVLLDRQALTGHKCYFLIFMGVSAFFDVFSVVKCGIIICQKVLISQKTRAVIQTEICFIG